MARCKQDGTDWKQALLELRAAPIDKDLASPMHILRGRPARTINGQAPAETLNMQDIREKLICCQEKKCSTLQQEAQSC